jgi:hypothetical protein
LIAFNSIDGGSMLDTTTFYLKFGPTVFHWHAACLGCDFTKEACGIRGLGYPTFLKCLKSLFDEQVLYWMIVVTVTVLLQILFLHYKKNLLKFFMKIDGKKTNNQLANKVS